jgi:hypothetical protein
MHPILKNISFKGLIKQFQTYIVCESKHGHITEAYIHNMYTIQSDDELREGINTDLEAVLKNKFTPLKFLGIQRVSEECYQITIRVLNKETGFESLYNWYVHRLPTCSERSFDLMEHN